MGLEFREKRSFIIFIVDIVYEKFTKKFCAFSDMNSQDSFFKFSATKVKWKYLSFACIFEASQQKHFFTFIWEINMCSLSKWINFLMSCHFHCTIFNSPDDDKSLHITTLKACMLIRVGMYGNTTAIHFITLYPFTAINGPGRSIDFSAFTSISLGLYHSEPQL